MSASKKYRAGFTPLEFIVSLAVILLISSQVIVSFSGLGQGVTLNRAGQELVNEIRKTQYAAIAVIYAPNSGLPPSPAVGIRLSTGSTAPQAIRFVDRNDCAGCVQNNKYDAGQNEKIGEYTLPGNIRISRLIDDRGNASYAVANVLFQVPEATVMITQDDGTPIPGNRIDIELASGTGAKKTVTVRVTGEINVH